MFHSSANGVGIKRSPDLQNWTDHGMLTLGQKEWPWMFFHGSIRAGYEIQPLYAHYSLGLVQQILMGGSAS